jgi:hypothetical protein
MLKSRLENRRAALVWLCAGLIAASWVALSWLVVQSPAQPVYDEPWYLKSIDLLWRDGLSIKFLRELPGPAGPTFTFIYAPIVELIAPAMPGLRLVNTALLALSAGLLGVTFAALKIRPPGAEGPTGAVLLPGLLLTLPTAAVSGGMTLTEVPALAFVAIFIALTAGNRAHPIGPPLAAGLALGLAILGRQNYLVILPCLVALLDRAAPWRSLYPLAITGLAAMLIAGPVFLVWGDLVPPLTAFSDRAIHPWYFVLSAGYLGVMAVLIVPEIYAPVWRRRMLTGLLIVAALAITATFGEPVAPGGSITATVTSPAIGWFCAFAFSVGALIFLAAMAMRLWNMRDDRFARFAGLVTVAGALSNAAIHQFSSRYIFVFLPFLLIHLARGVTVTWHLPVRILAGGSLGLYSLAAYFR